MIADYYNKISSHLKIDNQEEFFANINENILNEKQIIKSAQYLQTLKKNSFKIQQLVLQNDTLKQQNVNHLKNIELHLRKQIEFKLTISQLQQEIQILNDQITTLNMKAIHDFENFHSISPKQHSKLKEKLQNAIAENQILRLQNRKFYDQQFTKQKNYRYLQQKFKQTITLQRQKITELEANLLYQNEKACLLEKIQAENNILKSQNKRILYTLNSKLEQYELKINDLLRQLETQRFDKDMITQKYQQLTEVIQIIDKIRHQFQSKKKSLKFAKQQKQLRNQVEFNPAFFLIQSQAKPLQKTLNKVKVNKISVQNS